MIHDAVLIVLWLAGAAGCLFMIVAAAMLFWSGSQFAPVDAPTEP